MEIGKLYINGKWIETDKTSVSNNPADGSECGCVYEGSTEHVDMAVKAARAAFPEWSAKAATERASLLFKIADAIEARAEEFAAIDTMDNGKPLRDSLGDVYDSAACFRYYAGLVDKPQGFTYAVPDPNTQAMTVREPVGVCGLIAPWNYPLMMAAWKLAPCLAAGNTAVFKPSPLTPLSTVELFKLMENAGLPAGVVNLVMGGIPVGEAIVSHADIDKVVFTGGTETGKKIMRSSADTLKGIGLELGGKSPCVIFEDFDLETGVDWALFAIFCNQGEVCSAGSRLLLQQSIYDKFLSRLAARAQKIKVAPGTEQGAEIGPLISREHMEKVLGYIEKGKSEGAKLLCGGARLTGTSPAGSAYDKGFFVAPTIFADCTPNMTIVREEIFGPVLAVQKFKDEEEAIALANDCKYGLAAGVFTNDISRAMRVVKAFRAGITWVNAYHPTFAQAPWGGYKQSGIGRELGPYGLEEYTEIKQININLAPGPVGWFAE